MHRLPLSLSLSSLKPSTPVDQEFIQVKNCVAHSHAKILSYATEIICNFFLFSQSLLISLLVDFCPVNPIRPFPIELILQVRQCQVKFRAII